MTFLYAHTLLKNMFGSSEKIGKGRKRKRFRNMAEKSLINFSSALIGVLAKARV